MLPSVFPWAVAAVGACIFVGVVACFSRRIFHTADSHDKDITEIKHMPPPGKWGTMFWMPSWIRKHSGGTSGISGRSRRKCTSALPFAAGTARRRTAAKSSGKTRRCSWPCREPAGSSMRASVFCPCRGLPCCVSGTWPAAAASWRTSTSAGGALMWLSVTKP